MMYTKATLSLLFAALAAAGPIDRREVASLDPAATAEAHPRDNTATRAFSNVQIKTSDGKCLSVDPLSGDFRANLTPIQITDCGSAQGQGWDVITSGVHNDQKGQALIVSTLTQACFNFDPRRAAGNQVLLFSCGGRADGGGQVTNSQLFAFTGGNGPLSLTPENDPTKCLVPKGNLVDIADCSASDATQKFTIGGSAGGSDGSSSSNNSSSAAASSAAAGSKPVETQASATTSAAAVTSAVEAAVTSAADAAAATTLTVLATSVHTVISCAPTVTNCPARTNQTAIASLPESAKTTVVVTDTVVLATTVCPIEQASSISSSLQAAHSSGLITGSTITASAPAVTTAAQAAATTSAAASAATTAAAPGGDENAQCSAPRIVTVSEVVTVTAGQESASAAAAAATSAGVANNAGEGSSQTTAAASQPAITGNPTTPVPVSGAGGTLNPTAAAEANAFDTTAVRPVQSINIRAADGKCMSVNPTAGDFRENLIPIQMVTCSQDDPSQKFDIVTKGAHNDGTAGEALIVSVLTNGCVNFDGRRAANDQVIMFSCGGRADGSGKTATSQLFPFKNGDNNIVLTPASATNQTCLVAGADRVEAAKCDGQKDQVFQLVEIV
ncbi:hypothetical protein TASIC1_0011021900 [Trichoderma asperellum]|uniref:Ricin B lectin domain-containing protein n=1 Tax=Trichoderma asperellum TaxID=101201 RepID=A0A6V8R3H1_TRIAP|nr:hypothetical protein TASIC1_0011021900 [Trichoderma asperellum]